MSNINIISEDDNGLFIRKGSWKYRPSTDEATGGLTRGKTVRAWTKTMTDIASITVDTPEGLFVWDKTE
jgi:hypothetical protein